MYIVFDTTYSRRIYDCYTGHFVFKVNRIIRLRKKDKLFEEDILRIIFKTNLKDYKLY